MFFIVGYGEAIMAVGYKHDELMFPMLPTTFGDIERGLNRFYQEPENLIFPDSFALHFFTMKVNGASQSEVEAELKRLRLRVLQDEKP
jgi:hypothetical protein